MQDDTKLIEFIKNDLARGKIAGNLASSDVLIESEILDSLFRPLQYKSSFYNRKHSETGPERVRNRSPRVI